MNASKAIQKLFPVFVVCVGLVVLFLAARTPDDPESGVPLHRFAAIAVQENGRLMPFDTWARTKAMQLSHRQTIDKEWVDGGERGAKRNQRISATEWALETMVILQKAKEKKAAGGNLPDYFCFRIDSDQLLDLLDLKPTREHGYNFTLGDFFGNPKFKKEADRIIANGGPQKGNMLDERLAELMQKQQMYLTVATYGTPHLVPPPARGGDAVNDQPWDSIGDADPAALLFKPLTRMVECFAENNRSGFSRALDDYYADMDKLDPNLVGRMRLEVFFNNFAPYYQCIILFSGVLVLTLVSWLVQFLGHGIGATSESTASTWPQTIRRSAVALGALAMIVYTGALIARILISGYAPVTNLYSSAIFIGWGCALLCLGLEYILKNGIGTLVASVTSLAALIVAHNLLDGDSMVEVVAVLRSNFWLSTHVICITLGYTATFVAGFLGICYVILGMYTPLLRRDHILFGKVIYGVVCFAMFLSFVGTVLGGIWADQSWGRFWGWDPKENGALLIVIWNAVILHARWGGMVKTRGVALLAIFGNIVTAWSWFGTNLLGVGLHSYGFMKGAMLWLLAFAATQLVIIAMGALSPQKTWTSFNQPQST